MEIEHIKMPTKVIEKPAEVIEKPAEVIEKPAEVAEKPAEVIEKPAEVIEKPAEVIEKPAEVIEKPAEVAEKPAEEDLYEHLEVNFNKMMEKWIESYSNNCTGGKMRGDRGNDIELFVKESIKYIGENMGLELTAKKGPEDKKELKIAEKNIKKDHQVDIHVYHKDKFIAVIECKAYLDSCYYARALDDFKLFDKFGYKVKKYIFTLEDSLDKDTKIFQDFISDNACDGVIILLDGKRSSSNPIYDKKHAKKLNK